MAADLGAVAMHRLTWASGIIWLTILCGVPLPALAHVVEEAAGRPQSWLVWTFEPWVVLCLGLSLGLYAVGALRLGNRSTNRRSIIRQSLYFVLGWLVLVVALVSPLDTLGGALFSAHMVQHELLMIVAAPLLVLSRPLVIWLWALPMQWRLAIAGAVRHPLVRAPWRLLSLPLAAWIIHALALWLWHGPAFFDAALTNNAVHSLQHLSFLITALFFWWAVLDEQASAAGSGAAMLYLFTTMLHTGALGALMTFSTTPWYAAYHESSLAFGLSPVEDQQLGGLIMWIPGGVAYLLAGLALGAKWIGLAIKPPMRQS